MFNNWFPRGSLRRIIAGNTASQVIGRIISSGATVVMSLLIANRFGPEGYGDFVKVTTYVAFFYLLSDFGLNAVYLQRAVSAKGAPGLETTKPWQTLLGLRLIMTVVLVPVAFGVLFLLPYGLNQGYTSLVRLGIMLFAPVIIAQAITTTANALFQKMLRYDLATIAQNVGSVAMLVSAIVLFQFVSVNGSMLGVISVFVGSVVTSCYSLYLVRQYLGTIQPKFQFSEIFSLLKDGTPLGLVLLFNLVYFHSDSVVLTLTRSTREVGIYGLAYKVFELMLVLPIFFMNSIYPLLLGSQRDKKDQHTIFVHSLQLLVLSSVMLGVGFWIGAPLFTFIRPDFAASIAPLRILILGLPVYFVSALFMWFIIAEKQQHKLLLIHGIAMLGNIFLNMLLIPAYGYMAAAWITILSELFVLAASAMLVLPKQVARKGDTL